MGEIYSTHIPDRLPPLPRPRPRQIICNEPRPVVEVSSEARGRAVVTWDLPEVPQTDVKSFELYFFGARRVSSWLPIKKSFFPRPDTAIVPLVPDRRYHFIVRAIYVDGKCGQFSDPVSIDL